MIKESSSSMVGSGSFEPQSYGFESDAQTEKDHHHHDDDDHDIKFGHDYSPICPWFDLLVIPSSPSESNGLFLESLCPSIGSCFILIRFLLNQTQLPLSSAKEFFSS